MSDTLPPIDPKSSVLLVMDFQPVIVSRLRESESLLSRTAEVIQKMRAYGGNVGYVRVAFEDSDLAAFPATSRMGATVSATGRALHNASPATAVHNRVAPEEGDILVRKTRVGAFSTTDLHEQLRQRGIDTLILAGLSTSGVVLSTVRDAHDRDYRVFVLSDASADPDPEVHDFLIERIFPRQAYVITSEQLDDLLVSDPTTPAGAVPAPLSRRRGRPGG